MKGSFGKKTARIALILLLALLCALLVCSCKEAEVVEVDFDLDGEILPGKLMTVNLQIKGSEGTVKAYSDDLFSLSILSGGSVASVEGGKIRIQNSARADETFTVRLSVRDLSVERTFTVAKTEVSWILLNCADTVRAGDRIALFTSVYPQGAGEGSLPTYSVLSGDATIEKDVLAVSDRADAGEIVVQAILEGVKSDQKHIVVTTVQTRSVGFEVASETVLPGGTLLCMARKEPTISDYELTVTLEKGAEIAEYDQATGVLRVSEGATMGAEIVLLARSGYCEERQTVRVDRPDIQRITAQGGGSVAPGAMRSFSYSVLPSGADPDKVKITIAEGANWISDWEGVTFKVVSDAPQGAEIVFYLDGGKNAYSTLVYTVEKRTVTSITIDATAPTDYLQSGDSLTFTHQVIPADYDGVVNYRALEGGDLVTIENDTLTVKEGVGIGRVVLVAESADGTVSNPVELTICGRYSRRVYSSWTNVSLSAEGSSRVWMVLPNTLSTGVLTVVVPRNVVDLVIEGYYDGTDATAYRDLYFYFRNAPERTVTFVNFGTIATQGLGGTVMDFGSSGSTEIVLVGKNLIRADSPYRLDAAGEETDGVWTVESKYSSSTGQTLLRRSGKYGYRGAEGGTAISGFDLVFTGEGVLTAQAGNGVNGTVGGKGADAEYGTEYGTYVSGAGGDGGHGGDSGVAIYASSVRFSSGLVTALPGNAGLGAKGGSAGSLSAVVGKEDVVCLSGGDGRDGKDGYCYPAVRAGRIEGDNYRSSLGRTESRDVIFQGDLSLLANKIMRFYGVYLRYGTALENPFSANPRSTRYTMTQQTDATALMMQSQFLLYTMSLLPKNCWQELALRGAPITIYLCKKITSGSGSNILGLTSEYNKVWFATFNTEVRGVYYGGYYNIMVHEFTHAFHYNFTDAKNAFEKQLQSFNNKLSYGSTGTTGVYGVTANYNEYNSCFLSSYSRKTVMEDASETLSIPATFLWQEPPLYEGTTIRSKFDLLVTAFGTEYETLSAFKTGATLFAYPHLFE